MHHLEDLPDAVLLERTATHPEAFGVFYRRHVAAVVDPWTAASSRGGRTRVTLGQACATEEMTLPRKGSPGRATFLGLRRFRTSLVLQPAPHPEISIMRLTLAASAAVAITALIGLAPGPALAGSHAPTLVGTPSVRYVTLSDRDGPYVSVIAVFRTSKALDRGVFTSVAAPTLTRGQRLPGELFGGVTPSSLGTRAKHCYTTEAAQLHRRTKVTDRTWRFALSRKGSEVSGIPKRVRLARAPKGTAWQQAATRRLGCA